MLVCAVFILHSCKVDRKFCCTAKHQAIHDKVTQWDILLTNRSCQRKSMRPFSCLISRYHLSELLYFTHMQCNDLSIFWCFRKFWKCKWTFVNPSIFDWMKADLNVSMTVRKRQGLWGQNDWKSPETSLLFQPKIKLWHFNSKLQYT